MATLACLKESSALPQTGLEEVGVKLMRVQETWGCQTPAVVRGEQEGMQEGPAGDAVVVGAVGVAEGVEVVVDVVVEGVDVGEVGVGEEVVVGVEDVEAKMESWGGAFPSSTFWIRLLGKLVSYLYKCYLYKFVTWTDTVNKVYSVFCAVGGEKLGQV